MVTKSDWETAWREVVARGREQIDPPTPETLMKYSRGELSKSEADRVRIALAYYPDLAIALLEEPQKDEGQYLTDAQIEADWESLQRKMNRPAPEKTRAFPKRRKNIWYAAAAASLLLVTSVGSFFLGSFVDLQRPRANVERITLHDDTSRGGIIPATSSLRLHPSTEYVVVALALDDETPGRRHRAEIVDQTTTPARVIWKSPIVRGSDGTFVIEVPRRFLRSGKYRVNLYVDGEKQPIATYPFPHSLD